MSVISACVFRPGFGRGCDDALCQFPRSLRRFHERAAADFHVHDQALQSRGNLLRQNRRRDQRHGLNGSGHIANRIEASIRRREIGGLADDRAADLLHDFAKRVEIGRRVVARVCTRPCRSCRPCAPGRDRKSSARSSRRRPRSAPAGNSPCRRRRRSSACRRPVRRGLLCDQSSTVPEAAIASVSLPASSKLIEFRNIAIASDDTCSAGRLLSASPSTKNWISSSDSAPPSRFLRITSVNNMLGPTEIRATAGQLCAAASFRAG